MPLSASPGEDSIIAKIKEIPGIDVMESDYTDDSYIPETDANKMFVPYVQVKFDGAFQTYDNGICGPERDTLRATFTVYVVSPDAANARDLRDQVRVKLLSNFRPTDGSFLRPGNSYSFVDPDLGYQRYVQVMAFSYQFNLS